MLIVTVCSDPDPTSGPPILFLASDAAACTAGPSRSEVLYDARARRACQVACARGVANPGSPLGAFCGGRADELPQLLHVVTGRACPLSDRGHKLLEHDEQYGELVDRYLLRYKIKPGING